MEEQSDGNNIFHSSKSDYFYQGVFLSDMDKYAGR